MTDLSITDDKILKRVKSATRRIMRSATLYTDLHLYKMKGKVYAIGWFNGESDWKVAVEVVDGGKSFRFVDKLAVDSRSGSGVLHHLNSPFSSKEFIKIIEK